MELLFDFVVFASALVVLVYAARGFMHGATRLGNWLQLPPLVTGIFIVGMGTSLPELVTAVLSVQRGVSELVAANVVGANIANLLLITGLVAALVGSTIYLGSGYLYIDLHFMIGSIVFLSVLAYDGAITFLESFIGMVIFAVYTLYIVRGEANRAEEVPEEKAFPSGALGLLVLACIGIYFSAEFAISALQEVALGLGVPATLVAVTMLSLGTTLPELAVNIQALRQGRAELAIGNVLGSCIFNSAMIIPIATMFGPLHITDDIVGFSLPLMAASGLLFYLLTQDKKVSAWEGMLFLCLYALFLIKSVTFR
ncbi:MAG: sodium:calcium antiporter [Chitinophagales bacterium]|nr:sodium:calcium antiporter [Chitinophagales bacterium]MDW8428240.1 sodium:calcium antiporter [Chitinophagales bacterium]